MTPLARAMVAATALCGSAALATPPVQAHDPAGASAAIARADALIARMTLDEKLKLVHGLFPPMTKADPEGELIPSAGHIPGIPRLGIPILRESDASLGVANQVEQRKGDVATALPSGLAMAASFDPELVRQGGAMIGSEARAKRFNVLLAGGVNLTRDPWNGRNFEYLGEDPVLAGTLAGAAISGIQSNGIVSTVKHLALNSQETGRMVVDARLGEAALRESDLLAFEIAIERGRPGSVMCAYNKVNGEYACENAFLLKQVLRRDWKYPGWVMSDWGAVHSTEKAALSGLDQDSGQELDAQLFFTDRLKAAVAAGRVPESQIDTMVRHILTGMIANGLLDRPMPDKPEPIDYPAHAAVAQRVAEAGMVLLKNEGGLLPLARTAKRIVLIGGHADVGVLSGGGSSQVRSVGGVPIEIPLTSGAAASFARVTYHASSPLRAIRALAPGAEVSFVDGSDPQAAAAAAKGADVALVFATQWTTEAQDAEGLSLPDGQDALIAAVARANPHTAVVLETGGPVLMPWAAQVPAILQAWYPGQRGGEAIAALLFGAANPSGRLPITFPRSEDQAPRTRPAGFEMLKSADAAAAANAAEAASHALASFPADYVEGSDVGYRWYERKGETPLFPFGHGLSYTSFRHANLKVDPGQTLQVSVDVTNTGKRAGADVVQLYVRREGSTAPKRLAAFQRVELQPGETRRVTLAAEPRVVADYDVALPGWRIAAGSYRFEVAPDARAPGVTTTAKLEARSMKP